MRGMIVGSLGLTLGLLVTSAQAQDFQWRPATPEPAAPAAQSTGGVSLRAPVANTSSVQQTGWTMPTDVGPLVRGKLLDPPSQPAPVGPVLQGEKIPAPMGNNTTGPPQESKAGDALPQPMPMALVPNATIEPAPGGYVGNPGPTNSPIITSDCGGDCGKSGFLGLSWLGGNGCGASATGCDACFNGCCAPRSCFWVSAEYLLWTVKAAPTPPLVTTNGQGGYPVLGVPGTVVAYGGTNQDLDMRSGGRITIGFGLPCTDNRIGFETSALFIGDRSTSATFGSSGSPSVGRPFTDVGPSLNGFPGNQNAELVAFPGLVNGTVTVRTTNDLWGIEENLRLPIACGCNWKVDFLAGFRYLDLNEGLMVTENLNVEQPTTRGVGNIVVIDNFHTRNDFYGGQVGVDAEWRWRRWYLAGTGKLAMGDIHQSVSIDGATEFVNGPNPGVARGGLLALQGTNIGNYSRDTFAVMPELGLKLGFYFTEHLRAYVGYDVLYVSSVVRPGDQIDTNVNPTYLARNGGGQGAPLPAFQYRTTDFWAQGVSFGLEWRY